MSAQIPPFVLKIARVAFESNRAFCEADEEILWPAWNEATEGQRIPYVEFVRFRLEHPNAAVSSIHEKWLDKKRKDGWTYGFEESQEAKTSPWIAPHHELLPHQKTQNRILCAIVDAMRAQE